MRNVLNRLTPLTLQVGYVESKDQLTLNLLPQEAERLVAASRQIAIEPAPVARLHPVASPQIVDAVLQAFPHAVFVVYWHFYWRWPVARKDPGMANRCKQKTVVLSQLSLPLPYQLVPLVPVKWLGLTQGCLCLIWSPHLIIPVTIRRLSFRWVKLDRFRNSSAISSVLSNIRFAQLFENVALFCILKSDFAQLQNGILGKRQRLIVAC